MVHTATDSDARGWLSLALEDARAASDRGDLPVGTVVTTPDGVLLGRGGNRVTSGGDPTAHSEIDAIRRGGTAMLATEALQLYTTAEPCLMCLGAILNTRIRWIAYAAASTSATGSALEAIRGQPYMTSEVEKIVAVSEPYEDLRLESRRLMRQYFASHGDTARAGLLED